MRVMLLIAGVMATPTMAQVAPSAVTGPPSLSPWTGPIFPDRLSREKRTVHDPAFQQEAAALRRDMAETLGDRKKLSSADRATFEQRYAALLQRYGYSAPRFE